MSPKKNAGKPMFSRNSLIALALTLCAYLLLQLTGSPQIGTAWAHVWNLLLQILPVLGVVLLFMTGGNLVPNSFVKRHLGGKQGGKAYLFALAAGTLSHGPVYAWYPFLSELQKKGVSNGKIAAFLFARAIKIPLLAAMVFYFGLPFTIVFTACILGGALLMAVLFENVP
ncbi:MAG: hypothetical protein K9L66_13250 [Spirochaetaceae bacterium]|nr:hypothetical protein [Spirochaetaceae bacterium]MCF7949461.1 permease [Spirochaetia bacterium]MCF7952429.1 hypothetical protein [Spirochaetaceae bacterium]